MYQWRDQCRRHAVASTAVLATIATAVSFLGPITSRAAADSTSTTSSTTSTTAVPGSNCSATLNGSALNRSGWAASTNAASSSADAPAKAIDGNYSTRFSTGEHQAAGLYFQVNMGSAQSFNELKMSSPNSPNDYARGFDVEVSKDGNSWTTVASCTGTRTPETVSFPDQSEQYVKVVLSAGDSHYWWSVDELNLYGTPPPPTTTTTTAPSTTTTTAVPGSNCAAVLNGAALDRTGWTASTNAPSSGADAVSNAIDGNYSTRFSTDEHQAAGLYFQLNMGSAQSFNELRMSVPNSPTDYARGFDLQVSNDGSSWTTVASCTATGTPEVVGFSNQTAQYVRVVLTAADTHWWSVDEFDLLGPPPPPTTTTTTVPPTTTTTVPPFKFRGNHCLSHWPRSLSPGTLVQAGHRFFVVLRPCHVERVFGARVLVEYRVYHHGRVHTSLRWSYNFRLGSPMRGRLVELWVGGHTWLKWNGHMDRVPYLGVIG